MDITRRWFVFGSAAAITAAALPLGTQCFANDTPFIKREIIDISMMFNAKPGDKAVASCIDVLAGDRHMLSTMMNIHSNYRWQTPRGSGIILLPDELLIFHASEAATIASFCVGHLDYVDEGPPIHCISEYGCNGLIGSAPIFTDNSLEARIARRDAIPIPFYGDDYDDEDEQ